MVSKLWEGTTDIYYFNMSCLKILKKKNAKEKALKSRELWYFEDQPIALNRGVTYAEVMPQRQLLYCDLNVKLSAVSTT